MFQKLKYGFIFSGFFISLIKSSSSKFTPFIFFQFQSITVFLFLPRVLTSSDFFYEHGTNERKTLTLSKIFLRIRNQIQIFSAYSRIFYRNINFFNFIFLNNATSYYILTKTIFEFSACDSGTN